jgi:hypothetical protein
MDSPGTDAPGVSEALRMLDAFASVGAQSFDLTHLGIDGNKRGFRPKQTLRQLKTSLPILMKNAPARQNSIVIRPHAAPAVLLVQLDDLDAAALERTKPFAFLTLCTSPGNHQAWIAVESGLPDFARRLRKGAGADASASGAIRVAGTRNFKRKYAPDSTTARIGDFIFPVVTIIEAHPGRIVRKDQLEEAGLVAAPEPKKEAPASPLRASGPSRARGVWPSYERCVQNAPLNHGQTGPNISIADWEWCRTAYDWGWLVESVAERLMQVSSKARENGERYSERTAHRAAASVDARQQRGRG